METDKIQIQDFTRKIVTQLSNLKKLNIEQFSKRIAALEDHLKAFSRHTIRCGLIGITSSGKSSLLNTLLGTGEKILKEQSKATTNMIAFCSKAPEPALEIYFENSGPIKRTGEDVLAESIWKYTSEDENPHNKYNVKFIKLSLPTFMLDESLELADTPGLDAFGHKEHEDLTLREFLPQANLIIYLSSIRSPMKEADRRIIDKIMDADQRIIFVQTCKGSVVEQKFDEEGVRSVDDQLGEYKAGLRKAISHYDNLKDAPIVQIETAQAMEYLKSPDDPFVWRQSGLDEFIYVVTEATKQIKAEFDLINLRRIADESLCINQLINNVLNAKDERASSLEEQTAYLKRLQNCYEEIYLDMKKLVSEWSRQLDSKVVFQRYQEEFDEIYTARYNFNPMHDKKFLAKAQTIDDYTKKLKNEFLDTIDVAKKRYARLLRELGLDVRRVDYQTVDQHTFFLPNVQKKSLADALDTKEGKPPEYTDEYVDKNKYIHDLEGSLKSFFGPLAKHLEWWTKSIVYSFTGPLQKKTSAISEDMANLQEGIACDDTLKESLTSINSSIETAVRKVLPLFDKGPTGRKIKAYSRYIGKLEHIKFDSTNIFLQLGDRMFENLFHSLYLKCLDEMSSNEKKTVMLIGHNYASQVNFLRHLLRPNREMLGVLKASKPPFTLNTDREFALMENISMGGELKDKMSFFVLANDDKSLEAANTNGLFEKADIVQVFVDDLHRVGSAHRDMVERLLFFKLLINHNEKLLLTYPAAAHFLGEKLHILVTEAIAEINKVFPQVNVNWFIYENFEVRYCYFNRLAQKMLQEELRLGDVLYEWKSLGIPLDAPFTEDLLMKQFKMVVQNYENKRA